MGIKGQDPRDKKVIRNKMKKRFLLGTVALILLVGVVNKVAVKKGEVRYNRFPTSTVSAKELKKLPTSTVAVVQGEKESAVDLTEGEIKALVTEAVELAGGFKDRIQDGDSVVIKPNLVQNFDFTKPGWRGELLATEVNGVTTDWRVIKAVVELVRTVNPSGDLFVMEGSSGATSKGNMRYFKYTPEYIPGVTEFIGIEEDSGAWHEYGSPRLVKVHLEEGLLHKGYYLNRRYKEADFLISVPTLKNHWSGGVSGGIKNVGIGATPANIYGISPYNHGRNNMVEHDSRSGDLHKWIHDYFLCRPVDFVVIDGLQGIQNGPTPCYEMSGTRDLKEDQMNMRLILAGNDAVSVDTVEALLMCWDPLSIGHLVMLNESGAGNLDTSCIRVVGEAIDAVRKDFAGVKPIPGGEKFTDQSGPQLQVNSAELVGEEMNISVETAEETVKVEIYLNGELLETVTEDFSSFSIGNGLAEVERAEVKIIAYDRFLNQTAAVTLAERRKAEDKKDFTVTDTSDQAPRAAILPQIDGRAEEECWSAASWQAIDELWLGEMPEAEDFSGRYKVVWSPERLYFLVEVTDDVLSDRHKDPVDRYYEDDCLEIFIDQDHSGGDHTYNFNAFAYHIALDYQIVDLDQNGKVILLSDHAEIKRITDGSKHTWEIALQVFDDTFDPATENTPVTLSAGDKLGLALAYCDNDGGNQRESFMGSVHIPGKDKNVAWRDAGVFGTLELLP